VTGQGGRADTAYLLDSAGPAAPPRNNGELVFAAPWESQAFGLVVALADSGRIDWEDFRQYLIADIAAWESSHDLGDERSYYRCWLTAFERLAGQHGLVDADDLEGRAQTLRHDGQRGTAHRA